MVQVPKGQSCPVEERHLFQVLEAQRGKSLKLKQERSRVEATQEFHGKD